MLALIFSVGVYFCYSAITPTTAYASRGCANYTIDNQVASVISAYGYDYLLTPTGAVYTQCAPYYGGANGQGYFVGRVASQINLCFVNRYPVGYRIIATSSETYYYGRFSSCDEIWAPPSYPDFWLAAPVTDIDAHTGATSYILTTNGAVFGYAAPYFGGANGQGYFSGRTADYLVVCWDGSYVGYTIVATSNERYNYGRTTGCR